MRGWAVGRWEGLVSVVNVNMNGLGETERGRQGENGREWEGEGVICRCVHAYGYVLVEREV